MSDQMNLLDLLSAISSPESVSGPTPCAKPDGQMIDQCGPGVALVNLSARQAKEQGLLMSGTCGQPSTTSSASAALQSSLVSKLQAKTASVGSTLYTLTWKQRDTPAGRSISALRASVRRISDSGSGGLGWPTPQMRDFRSGGEDRVSNPDRSNNLNDFVLMTAWPTPTTRDHKGGYHGGRIRDGKISLDTVDVAAQLAGWTTPIVQDSKQSGLAPSGTGHSMKLSFEVQQSGWTTPQAHDVSGRSETQKDLHGTNYSTAGC